MKTLHFFVIFIFLGISSFSQSPGYANLHILDPYNPEFVPGEVLVKFKDDVPMQISMLKSVPQTGLTTIDEFISKHNITLCKKVFQQEEKRTTFKTMTTPDGQTYEVPQLFNIYKFKASENSDVNSMVEEFKDDPLIDFAEPNYYFYTMEVIEKSSGIRYPASGIRNESPVFSPQSSMLNSSFLTPHSSLPIPHSSLPIPPPSTTVVPNDPMYSQQWYLPAVNAPEAWDSVTGDTSQIIGIIDTGVDWDHPDLDDNIWTNWDEIPGNGVDDDGNGYIDDIRGWDFVNDDNDPNDDNSHGTHVAGIAAAEGNNGVGICGVAWDSRILPIKVLQSSGYGSSSDIASGVTYAWQNGATVLNLSLGSYGESLTLRTALENAYSSTVIVAAAGNDEYKVDPPYPPLPLYAPHFPACYSWVFGVQASMPGGSKAIFSNTDLTGPVYYTNVYGHNYEIIAPGITIQSTVPNGGYHALNGTSMATPILTGAIALMKSHSPGQTNEQIFAKVIQSANNNILDMDSALTIDLVPDLNYITYTIVDTLPGGDNDGIADAGETIQLYLQVNNAGGFADSVWSKIRFAPYEDTTVATIIDSTSYIGDISVYASLTGIQDPFKIFIKPSVSNNRNINLQYEVGSNNSNLQIQGNITLIIQKGVELGGILSGSITLSPENYYLLSQSLIIPQGDTLTILPGTTLGISDNKSINCDGKIISLGNKDSLITFTAGGSSGWNSIQFNGYGNGEFDYCKFERTIGTNIFLNNNSSSYYKVSNSIFSGNSNIATQVSNECSLNSITNCLFTENITITFAIIQLHFQQGRGIFFLNNVVNNVCQNANYGGIMTYYYGTADSIMRNNNIVNNQTPIGEVNIYGSPTGPSISLMPNNYFGRKDSLAIANSIYDYFDNPTLRAINFCPYLERPSSLTHGIVWKILVDSIEINKYDYPYYAANGLGIIGPGLHRFVVYFNRAMDTTYTPFLTFGVREPYTQRVVADSASWSVDSTIWTAYYTIGVETGDGINRIRVANARDDEHFEIPIEDSRFEFVIQAAGAASIEFMATPGIGKVYMEWNRAGTEDALGYNMYRYFNITDTIFSTPIMINSSLIIDTLYTDYDVIPDTTYHYYYKVLGTDLVESDSSKIIVAIPLAAANGDANGDLVVNVLDITTVISYMLNQDPEPFLFDAADVNGDDVINVLDIIGIVDIILGKKKLVSQVIGANTNPAYIYLDPDGIRFKSEGQVAAMQFELAGQNLEQIRLLMKQQGFEFASGMVNGKLMGILYNFNNRTIPEGMLTLISIEGSTSTLSWGNVVSGDPEGNYVLVLKDEPEPLPVEDYELRAFPNPFKESVTITYRLPQPATITLHFYNSHGQLIKSIENREKQVGNHKLEWNGKGVPAGIYYCRLLGITKHGKEIKSEIKIVLIK